MLVVEVLAPGLGFRVLCFLNSGADPGNVMASSGWFSALPCMLSILHNLVLGYCRIP